MTYWHREHEHTPIISANLLWNNKTRLITYIFSKQMMMDIAWYRLVYNRFATDLLVYNTFATDLYSYTGHSDSPL